MNREIVRANLRVEELDRLFKRIYEDHVIRRLSDERFEAMSNDYDAEQQQLKLELIRMEAELAKGEEVTADFQRFLRSVRKYTDITELTPTILNELISRIEIHAPDKSTGKRRQDIDIYYNAVGIINLPTSEEMDAMETEYLIRKQKSKQTISA